MVLPCPPSRSLHLWWYGGRSLLYTENLSGAVPSLLQRSNLLMLLTPGCHPEPAMTRRGKRRGTLTWLPEVMNSSSARCPWVPVKGIWAEGPRAFSGCQWGGVTKACRAVPDKDDVTLSHMLVGVRGEEQVAIPGCLHHLVQPRLVDGQLLHVHTSVPWDQDCVACLRLNRKPKAGTAVALTLHRLLASNRASNTL